jgi:uncharacterized protein (TIGR02147 family)
MPDVFEYVGYREFLRDYYREKKAASKGFSFQNFARKAKIGSSGFLLHVMKGERNLSGPVLLNVAQAMGLDKAQTECFGNLVAFDQARTQAERNFHYDRIMAQRRTARALKAEMKEFNKRVLALAQGDARPPDRVYHVNLNFFPVTRKVGGQRA